MRGHSCAVVLGCKAEPSRASLRRRSAAQALGEVRQQVRGEVVAVEEGRARAEAAAAAARADARASRDELAALKVCSRPGHRVLPLGPSGTDPCHRAARPFPPLTVTELHAPLRPLPEAPSPNEVPLQMISRRLESCVPEHTAPSSAAFSRGFHVAYLCEKSVGLSTLAFFRALSLLWSNQTHWTVSDC